MNAWQALDPTTKQVIVGCLVLLGFLLIYLIGKGVDPPD